MKTISVNMCNISIKLHTRTYRARVRWDVWSLWLWCNSLESKVLRSNTSLAIAFLFCLQYRFIIDLKLNLSKPRWILMATRNAIKEDLKSGSRFVLKSLRACLHDRWATCQMLPHLSGVPLGFLCYKLKLTAAALKDFQRNEYFTRKRVNLIQSLLYRVCKRNKRESGPWL